MRKGRSNMRGEVHALLTRWSLKRMRVRGPTCLHVILPIYTMVLILVFPSLLSALTGLTRLPPDPMPHYLAETLTYDWVWAAPSGPDVGPLPDAGGGDSGPLWARVQQRRYTFANGSTGGWVPYAAPTGSLEEMEAHMAMAYQTEVDAADARHATGHLDKGAAAATAYRMPMGGLAVRNITATPHHHSSLPVVRIEAMLQYGPALGMFGTVDAGTRGMKLVSLLGKGALEAANVSRRVYEGYQEMPRPAAPLSVPSWVLWSGTYVMFGQAISWVLPLFTGDLVAERNSPYLQYMRAYGLTWRSYATAITLFDTAQYGLILALCLLMGIPSGNELFTTGIGGTCAISLAWGCIMVGASMALSVCFRSARTAAIVLYLCVFVGPAFQAALQTQFFSSRWASYVFLAYPPTTFFRALYLWEAHLHNSPPTAYIHLQTTLIALSIQAVVVLTFGLFINYAVPLPGSGEAVKLRCCAAAACLRRRSRRRVSPLDRAGEADEEEQQRLLRSDRSASRRTPERSTYSSVLYRREKEQAEAQAARLAGLRAIADSVRAEQLGSPSDDNDDNDDYHDYDEEKGKVPDGSEDDDDEYHSMESSTLGLGRYASSPTRSPPTRSQTRSGSSTTMRSPVVYSGGPADEFSGPGGPSIIVDGLTKMYGDGGEDKVRAVDDVSFTLERGAFGLIGANGAGKTTLLKMLMGLLTPSSGNAVLGGISVLQDPGRISSITGVCPQTSVLWPELTVLEHGRFFARLRGFSGSRLERHVASALSQTRLNSPGMRHQRVGTLSLGAQRRLTIAIALIGSPPILLLDEPDASLDAESLRSLWSLLSQIKSSRTVILTTHSMETAERVCDTIGIVSKGRLLVSGSPRELKDSFGFDYRLSLLTHPDPQSIHRLRTWVLSTVPNSELVQSFEGSLVFSIQSEISLASLFRDISDVQTRLCVLDWSLSRISLEDVFVGLVRNEELENASVGPITRAP